MSFKKRLKLRRAKPTPIRDKAQAYLNLRFAMVRYATAHQSREALVECLQFFADIFRDDCAMSRALDDTINRKKAT